MIDARREPDLGMLGNTIREQLASPVARDWFGRYWQGKGEDLQLTPEQFQDILRHIPDQSTFREPSKIEPVPGMEGDVILAPLQRRIRWYGDPMYDRALGAATLYYDQNGNPIGLHDIYGFAPKPPKTTDRGQVGEWETRAVGLVGPRFGAKPDTVRAGWTPK